MDLSVVICTYNRGESLFDTLSSLGRQDLADPINWEIIVVDNNSTDRTRNIVEAFAHQTSVTVKYLFESQQGKSYALNQGLREAKGTVIALTDDDVIVAKNWVSSVWRAMQQQEVDGIGGRILPKWARPVPKWLEKSNRLWTMLALIDGSEVKSLQLPLRHEEGIVWGANMAFRRTVFEEVGFFDVHLGPCGKKLFRGDDLEFVQRCLSVGKKVIFDPTLLVWHCIGVERMSRKYFRKWCLDSAENGASIAEAPNVTRQFLGAPLWFYRVVATDVCQWLPRAVSLREDAFERELEVIGHMARLWRIWKVWCAERLR
jgi:glycosyltransferase involved in cell wall biosynthesis